MLYIKNAVIRGIIPLVILTGISLLMRYQDIEMFQVKSTFLVGLIITAVAASSVIYDVEEWSLMKQSFIHFIIMTLTVLPCLIVSGWFPLNSLMDYLVLFGIFLLVGLILWGVNYFIYTIRDQ